jgi:hypothetical protein
VEIVRFRKWGRAAAVRVRRLDGGRIEIRSENVAVLRLTPGGVRSARDGTSSVLWNKTGMGSHTPGKNGAIELVCPGYPAPKTARLFKSRAVCGPASDVFSFPFVAVRGTAGTAAETSALAQLCERFCRDWEAYAEGRVRVLTDTEIAERTVREKGLVLFGLPETNRILARMANRLPLRLSREKIALPGGREFRNTDLGLVLAYPNPLSPERYILIYNGLPWGGSRSKNHRFDLLPDFAIYTADAIPNIDANRFLAAGLFDEHWQYSSELTDFGPGP